MNRRWMQLLMQACGLLGLTLTSTRALPHERLLSYEPLLLPKATRAVFNSSKCVAIGIPLKPGYFWQSPATLLCFRMAENGRVNLFRVEVANGREVPLTRLNAIWAKTLDCGWMRCATRTKPHRFFCQPYVENVALSPDGKRLLWLNNRRPVPQWVVATLDGTQVQQWDARTSFHKTRAFWSPNSQTCVVRAFADRGLFTQRYNVRTRQHSENSISIPARWKTLEATFPERFSSVLATGELLFMPRTDREKTVTQVPLCALTLQGAIRRWNLPLPFPAQIEELKLSPDGTRLALLLHSTLKLAGSSSAQSVHRLLSRKSEVMESVWTCGVAGGKLQKVGHIRVAQSKDEAMFRNLLAGLN